MFGNFIGLRFRLSLTLSFFFLLTLGIACLTSVFNGIKNEMERKKERIKVKQHTKDWLLFFFFFVVLFLRFIFHFLGISHLFFCLVAAFFHHFQTVCFMLKRPVHKCLMFNFDQPSAIFFCYSCALLYAISISCSLVVFNVRFVSVIMSFYAFSVLFLDWSSSPSLSLRSDRLEPR